MMAAEKCSVDGLGSWRVRWRGVAAGLAVMALLGATAACVPATTGRRCAGSDFGRDQGWIVQCKKGRWRRVIQVADLLRLIEQQRQQQQPPAPVAGLPPVDSQPVVVAPVLPPTRQPEAASRAVLAPDTVAYAAGVVAATVPAQGTGVVLRIPATQRIPIVGGHVVVAPTVGLPDGMFARVVAVTATTDGTLVEVVNAPTDDVFSDISIDDESTEPPQVVDESGNPVLSGNSSTTGATAMATPLSAWECRRGGLPASLSDLWEASGDPINLRFENTRVHHYFSAGGLLDAPVLHLQLSGELVVSIGYTAKLAGFSCELSPTFRRNHRLRIPLPSVYGVPVSANLEPAIKFEIGVEGLISLEQRHYFGITLEQDGLSAPNFRLSKSADAPSFQMQFSGAASAFVGGDLSFMFGGGRGTANAQAGVFGSFGPELKIEQNSTKRECVEVNLRLIADFGVRLELWSKRWSPTVAKLSSDSKRVLGPWCPPGGIGPGSGGGTTTPTTAPPTWTPGAPVVVVDIPRRSGPSGQHLSITGSCPTSVMPANTEDLYAILRIDGVTQSFAWGWYSDESDGSFTVRTSISGSVGTHKVSVECRASLPGHVLSSPFATSGSSDYVIDAPTGDLSVVGAPVANSVVTVTGRCRAPAASVTIRDYRATLAFDDTDDYLGSESLHEVPVGADGTLGPVQVTVQAVDERYKVFYVQAWCTGASWLGALDSYDWRIYLPTVEVGTIVAAGG